MHHLLLALFVSAVDENLEVQQLEAISTITVLANHQEVLQILHQKEYKSGQYLHTQNFFKSIADQFSTTRIEIPYYCKYFSSLHMLATSIYISTCFDADFISPKIYSAVSTI